MRALVTQNTVLALNTDNDGNLHFFQHPKLLQSLAPRTETTNISLHHNIGFANNVLFMMGADQFDKNCTYGITPKNPDPFKLFIGTPCANAYTVLTPLGAYEEPATSRYAFQAVLSPLSSTVFQEIEEQISFMVSESPAKSFIIGGEFSLSGYTKPSLEKVSSVTVGNYFDTLPDGDYSDMSLDHFRKWLTRKYLSPEDLNFAWYGTSAGIPAISDADPRIHAFTPSAMQDWINFQDYQHQELKRAQYRIAKSANPNANAQIIVFGLSEAEEGALHSDGISSGDWYLDNSAAAELEIATAALGRVGSSYRSKVMNFPIFGFPRTSGVCYDSAHSALESSIPSLYRSPCNDEQFSTRVLHRFLVDGISTVGVGYWVGPDGWNQHIGTGRAFFEQLAQDVENLRPDLIGMTPYFSPLLVHMNFENTFYSELTNQFAKEQFQYAPVDALEALERPDVTMKRSLFLSAYRDDVSEDLLTKYRALVSREEINGLVFLTIETRAKLTSILPTTTFSFKDATVKVEKISDKSSLFFITSNERNPSLITSSVVENLIAIPNATTRLLRPFTVEPLDDKASDAFAVGVASDGINYMVQVFNGDSSTRNIRLKKNVPAFRLGKYRHPLRSEESEAIELAGGESRLLFFRAKVPAELHRDILRERRKITRAITKLTKQGYSAPGVEFAMEQVDSLSGKKADDQKRLTLLLRVQQQPFIQITANGLEYSVNIVDIRGKPLKGSRIALTNILHDRKQEVLGETNSRGQFFLNLQESLPSKEVWDFKQRDYVTLSGAAYLTITSPSGMESGRLLP